MTLLDEPSDLAPTEQEIASYRQHGWYLSRLVIPSELIDDALYDMERHYAGERGRPLLAEHYVEWQPGRPGLRLTDYMSLQYESFQQLVSYPAIGGIAARLTGLPPIRLFHDQLIYKPPAEPGSLAIVGWHTDRAYWRTCSSEHMLTAWVAFQDCEAQMGALRFIEGSHLWDGTLGMKSFYDEDVARLEAELSREHREFRVSSPALRKGQVMFHNSRTIHGSPPNRSELPRIALAIHLQDGTNCYVKVKDEHGHPVVHVIDTLCRSTADGNPDYSDPDICPVLCAT
ncbi:phytanoyl-CoA dioxygenase family protein [Bradyrhizobium sp. SZCCHNR1015]|uniref:phytanoyl-CoA dioxygenase family protein n=1 Tax=Bradyrhizobium sp. SZCCHNR1015 TaxID=3057338 RepID=UPI0029161878|nr:phytanoyl-CoA dioxygenase family protein [Bradyrhizobium sp. SZCCHNR1015]